MKTIRRILFVECLLALGLTQVLASNIKASVTKVGNGDDGADLEALTPITSGPIFESRLRALDKLKSLNIVGVPGLGVLIPEVERTELFLASKNVHPTGEQQGSLETSEDNTLVYARTFAEPYAATRFFPAALGLTENQLVALHIHEALHRSLPSDIRTDENVVMHLTMAITSPGAHFDRIRQVASRYIKPPTAEIAIPNYSNTYKISEERVPDYKSKSKFGYDFVMSNNHRAGNKYDPGMQGLEYTTGILGFKKMSGIWVEPILRARMKFMENKLSATPRIGATSFDLQAHVKVGELSSMGPFIRFTAKSFDEPVTYENYIGTNNENSDRDIVTMGFFYKSERDYSYFDSQLFYSLPSTARNSNLYESVLTLSGRYGFRWGRLHVGGLAELHASEGWSLGKERDSTLYYYYGEGGMDSFRMLVAGPELSFEGSRFEFKLYYKSVVNNISATLSDLGDVVDRGNGRSQFGTSISVLF